MGDRTTSNAHIKPTGSTTKVSPLTETQNIQEIDIGLLDDMKLVVRERVGEHLKSVRNHFDSLYANIDLVSEINKSLQTRLNKVTTSPEEERTLNADLAWQVKAWTPLELRESRSPPCR
ncbi:hypothetical protein QFC21_006934 [Naganishia friedmannii]|uniref:Uncharacterized protein n=1 Tax=Naganishia friedmannii TaxID=89922 RepID=A0ACC2UZL7_9TREE|nr:hypothetical protein QFC21_006934 [Naganishia friedmannii]